MFRTLPLVALLATAACVTPQDGGPQQAAPQPSQTAAPAASNSAAVSLLEPALQACLPYAQGGALDTAALTRAGFAPRRTPLGTTVIENGDIYAITNDRRGTCRVTLQRSSRGAPVRTALNSVIADNGYAPAGNSGNRMLFSDGTRTLAVRAAYVQSTGVRQWDVILSRP